MRVSRYSVLLIVIFSQESYLEVFSETRDATAYLWLNLTETALNDRKVRALTTYLHNSAGTDNRCQWCHESLLNGSVQTPIQSTEPSWYLSREGLWENGNILCFHMRATQVHTIIKTHQVGPGEMIQWFRVLRLFLSSIPVFYCSQSPINSSF